MKRATCEECQAFNVLASECRRHAPNAVPVPKSDSSGRPIGMASFGVYPATSKEGWCLEHVPIVIGILQ